HPGLLVGVAVLGHDGPRRELDRGERRLGAVDRAPDDAVPELERDDLVEVVEGGHVPTGCQTVFSSRNAEISYSDWASGAPITTTPVGSGIVKLKYGPATGLDEPSTCASLSAKPAYHTQRSIAFSTSAFPEQSAANSGTRASIISAMR